MTKYNNHIYMLICEITLSLYKETNFSTHYSYCSNMCLCLKDRSLSSKQTAHICKIADALHLVFSMDSLTAGRYISNFFELEKHKVFEKAILGVKEFYPNAMDKF